MELAFTKMNGAGNDFVLLDNRAGNLSLTRDGVVRLCHRQRGVGADGVFLVVRGRSGRAEWGWEFYNRDGSTAAMCGNGARCFARYLQRLTGACGDLAFETGAGLITAQFQDERVTVNLTRPCGLRLGETLELTAGPTTVHALNTGVPHAVLFVSDTAAVPVESWGAEVRSHARFAPDGTNVNFVELREAGLIRVRTYERGVEGETLACGTGVTAAALIAARVHGHRSPVQVQVRGGDILEVSFNLAGDAFDDVRLTGPADFVFEGRIQL